MHGHIRGRSAKRGHDYGQAARRSVCSMSPAKKAATPVTSILRGQGIQFVRMMQGALRLFALYSTEHPQAQSLVQRALQALQAVLKETATLSIGFQFNNVLLNSLPFSDPSLSFLAGELAKRRVGFISFTAGIDEAELCRAIAVLATGPDTIEKQGGLGPFLRNNPLAHARIVGVQTATDEGNLAVITSAEEAAAMAKVPRWLLQALQQTKGEQGVTVGPEQLQALAAGLDPSLTPQQRALLPQVQELLTDIVRQADPSAVSQMLRDAAAGGGTNGAELLKSALLQNAALAASRGDVAQAERMLRGLAAQEQDPRRLLEAFPAGSLTEKARRRLTEYAEWMSHPAEARPGTLKTRTQEYYWLLAEIENAGAGGKADLAAQWLLALFGAEGPADDADRLTVLGRARDSLAQLCGGGLPGNAQQLQDAIVARLCRETCLPVATALAEALSVLIDAAAQRRQLPLATAGAAAVAQLASQPSIGGRAARQLQPRLFKPSTLAQLVAAWIDKGQEEANRGIAGLLKRAGDQAARELLAVFEKEPKAARRLRIDHLVRRLGKAAAPALLERISHPRWYIIRDAVLLLGDLGDPALLEHLDGPLAHEDERVQREAVQAAIKTRSQARGVVLARALPSLKPNLVETVLDDLLILKEPSAVPFLECLVRQPQAGLRPYLLENALAVMGAIETQEAVECLLDCAGETTLPLPLRKAALNAVARVDTTSGHRALEYFARTCVDAELAQVAEHLRPVWQY